MITQNKLRIGNFTSSEINALLSEPTASAKKQGEVFGKPAFTYIEECNFERKLGRSISTEVISKPLSWGKILETNAFQLLGMEYSLISQETKVHPTIDYWAGSADGLKYDEGKTIIDIKCPFTLKSFCQLVDPLYDNTVIDMEVNEKGIWVMNKIRETHKEGEKYYWQLVSNAIINDCKYAELIVYVPYETEIPDIKLQAEGIPHLYWLSMGNDEELPSLKEGGFYKNINTIRFEVPQNDKDFLTEKVKLAGKLLKEFV